MSASIWNAVTPQLVVLGSVGLICLGLLLGATWTIQAFHTKLRHRAEERRRLNEEWSAIRVTRWRQGSCPRCAGALSERDWYSTPIPVEDPPK